jgi:hypothetical protein
MHKQIVSAILRRDEPEPLVRVEPLHCTLCHVIFSLDPCGPIDCSLCYGIRGRLRGRKAYTFTKGPVYHATRLTVYKINPQKPENISDSRDPRWRQRPRLTLSPPSGRAVSSGRRRFYSSRRRTPARDNYHEKEK